MQVWDPAGVAAKLGQRQHSRSSLRCTPPALAPRRSQNAHWFSTLMSPHPYPSPARPWLLPTAAPTQARAQLRPLLLPTSPPAPTPALAQLACQQHIHNCPTHVQPKFAHCCPNPNPGLARLPAARPRPPGGRWRWRGGAATRRQRPAPPLMPPPPAAPPPPATQRHCMHAQRYLGCASRRPKLLSQQQVAGGSWRRSCGRSKAAAAAAPAGRPPRTCVWPSFAASISAVQPSPSRSSSDTPRHRASASTAGRWPCSVARCRGVAPSLVRLAGSAPSSSSALSAREWPPAAAMCAGVQRLLSAWAASALGSACQVASTGFVS